MLVVMDSLGRNNRFFKFIINCLNYSFKFRRDKEEEEEIDDVFVAVEIKVNNHSKELVVVVEAVIVAEHLEVVMLERSKLPAKEKLEKRATIIMLEAILMLIDRLMEEGVVDLEEDGDVVKEVEEEEVEFLI